MLIVIVGWVHGSLNNVGLDPASSHPAHTHLDNLNCSLLCNAGGKKPISLCVLGLKPRTATMLGLLVDDESDLENNKVVSCADIES
jgi:hypothetical protein